MRHTLTHLSLQHTDHSQDHLEALILQIQQQIEPITKDFKNSHSATTGTSPLAKDVPRTALGLLDDFQRELKEFKSIDGQPDPFQSQHQHPSSSKASVSPRSYHNEVTDSVNEEGSRKRRRLDGPSSLAEQILDNGSLPANANAEALLHSIIAAFSEHVHPWIPMLHQSRLQRRMRIQPDDPALRVILHALVVAAIRFVGMDSSHSADWISQVTKASRDFVVLNAPGDLCVSSIEALIIVAYNEVSTRI